MADTLVERITGQPSADAVPVTVNLVVSDQTLLNGGHEPAWLQGYGPLPPDHTRGLTQQAIDNSLAALRRLYATPTTGTHLALDSVARTFPQAPICHHDHAVPRAAGGPTTAVNGQGLCEHCNYTKEAPGWRTRPITGPPDHPHTTETVTPTGHTVRSTAPPSPHPAHSTRTAEPSTTSDNASTSPPDGRSASSAGSLFTGRPAQAMMGPCAARKSGTSRRSRSCRSS
jgi:hypothetical protein